MLATCGEDRKLKIWDVSRAGQTAAHSFDLVSTGSGLNFNSEDSKVTTGLQNGTIKLWDLESCKDFRVLSGHRAEVCHSRAIWPQQPVYKKQAQRQVIWLKIQTGY